jgi:hypothetical protein
VLHVHTLKHGDLEEDVRKAVQALLQVHEIKPLDTMLGSVGHQLVETQVSNEDGRY